MTEKPDSTKIDAALKRAAEKAVYGTREERSGRFVLRDDRLAARGESQSTKLRRQSERKK